MKSPMLMGKKIQSSANHFKSENIVSHYHIGKKLGQGSYSKVYTAWDIQTRQKFAVKILEKERVGDKWKQEFQIQSSLSHPNIAKIVENYQTPEKIYIFMEYCENGELYDFVRLRGSLSSFQVQKYISQLTSTVKYLHSKNIAHSDIKLENILLDEDMNIKLIDFGFAQKIPKKNKKSTEYYGSGIYSVPQITLKKPYDAYLADIWSVGVCLYIMVKGEMPFNIEDKEYIEYGERSYENLGEFREIVEKTLTLQKKRIALHQISQLIL